MCVCVCVLDDAPNYVSLSGLASLIFCSALAGPRICLCAFCSPDFRFASLAVRGWCEAGCGGVRSGELV